MDVRGIYSRINKRLALIIVLGIVAIGVSAYFCNRQIKLAGQFNNQLNTGLNRHSPLVTMSVSITPTPTPTPKAGTATKKTTKKSSGSTGTGSSGSTTAYDSLVVYGDTRTGHDIHQTIVNHINARSLEAVFHVGDLVNDGSSATDWATFNNITATIRSRFAFYPTLGNHEGNNALFYSNFTLPNNEQWFKIDFDNIVFIVVNSNASLSAGSEQYNWLNSTLQSVASSGKFIAMVFHHPPYSTGSHAEDEKGLRGSVVPLFRQYGVDVVFNGHDHNYERSYADGIYYLVVGSAGAPLYDQTRSSAYSQLFLKTYNYSTVSVSNSTLSIRVYNQNNSQIDSVSLSK